MSAPTLLTNTPETKGAGVVAALFDGALVPLDAALLLVLGEAPPGQAVNTPTISAAANTLPAMALTGSDSRGRYDDQFLDDPVRSSKVARERRLFLVGSIAVLGIGIWIAVASSTDPGAPRTRWITPVLIASFISLTGFKEWWRRRGL